MKNKSNMKAIAALRTRKNRIVLAGSIAALLSPVAAHATSISLFGAFTTQGGNWRTLSGAQTAAYSIDGNTVLGSDGWWLAGNNGSFSQPSYVTSYYQTGNIYGGNGGYYAVDNPASPGNTTNPGTTTTNSNGDVFRFTLGNTLPSTIRVGVMIDALDNTYYNPSSVTIKLNGVSMSTVTTSAGIYNDRNPDWLFWDIANLTATDEITFTGVSNSNQVTLTAFAFDHISAPTQIWNAGASGNWSDATWTGSPPNFPDATVSAKIDTAYTVTVDGNRATYMLTVLNDGKLVIATGNSLTVASTVSVASVSSGFGLTMASGSTLSLGSGSVGSLSGTNATIAVGAGGTLTVGDATASSFDGVISGSGANLTKAGAGTLTLTGTNTYTGATTASNGTLNMANLGATTDLGLGAAGTAGRINYTGGAVASAAGITVAAGGGRFDNAGSGAVTLNGTVTGTGGNLTIGGSGDTVLAKGTSLGAGTLTKVDAGMLTSASNTVGAATISGGTMVASTISGTASVNSGGTLKMQGSFAPVSGMNAWFDASTLALSNGAAISTWADLSGQNHTATKSGGGTITLATNQVNGLPVAQFRGDRVATLSGSLYAAQEYAVFSMPSTGGDWGAILGSGDSNQGYLFNKNGYMWDARYPNGVSQNGGAALSPNYQLSNPGNFMVIKIDNRNGNTGLTNNWRLGGQEGWNNFDMNLAEVISYDHVLNATEANQVGYYLGNKYGVANAYTNPGASASLGGLAGSGIMDLNSAVVNVGSNNASTTFSGTLLDSVVGGTLVKKGAGTLTLSGSGTYTGATTITAGKVQVSSPGSYASTFTVNSGTLGGSGTVGGIVLSSTGLLTPGDEGGTVGTLTAGSVTLNAGGVMDFEFSGANSDLINVTTANGLTINGGSFHLYQAGGTSTVSTLGTYNLFQYSTGFTGLGNISTTSILNKISGLHYGFGTRNVSGNDYVDLTISAGPVWNGGGGDNLWSSSANWSNVTVETNDTLAYGGSTRTTSTNDLTLVTQLRSIVFKDTATGAFTLGGNGITLIADFDNNLIRNDSTATQTINLPVTVGVAGAFVNTTNAAGTTVLGGTFNNNGNTLLVTGPGSTTISATGTITGSGGLTKSGGGTLAINAATTFTGNTRIAAGTLTVGHQNALVNTIVDMNVADAGALTFSVAAATLGGLTGTRNINMGAANVSIGAKNEDTTYKGSLSGGTGLTKVGSAVLTLAGTNSYGGDTLISTGTLRLVIGSQLGINASGFTGTNSANPGGSRDLDGAHYFNSATRAFTGDKGLLALTPVSSAIGYMGQVVSFDMLTGVGSGVDNFSTAFSGQFNPTVTGNYRFRSNNDDHGSMYIDFNNDGILQSSERLGGVTGNFDSSSVSLTAGSIYSYIYMSGEDGGGENNNFYITIPGGNEEYVNPSSGNQTGLWTYSTAGSVSDYIPNTSRVTVVGGATLDLNGNVETVGPLAGAGSVTLGTSVLGRLTVNSTTGNDTTFSGVISGAGAFTKAGPAALTLSGANTFTGDSRIAAGTLKVGTPLALQNSTLDMNAADAGTFDMNGNDATLGGLKGTRNIAVIASHTLSIGNNNQLTTYSGALTGLGALTKIGTGTFAITGANNYSGSTTIAAGALNVGSGSGLSASSNLAFNGTNPVLEQSGTFSRAVGTGAGQVQWVTGGGFAAFGGALAVQLGGNTSQVTWSGTVGDGHSLVLNSTSANNVADFQNALNLGGSARTVQVLDNTGSTADWGRISGTISNGSLVKTGAGLLALAGNNTFTGGVAIGAGTVQVAHTGALNSAAPNAVSFTAGSTGTLQLNGNSVTVSSLSTDAGNPGTAFVVNSHTTAADLSVFKASGTDTFAGVMKDGTGGGALGLTKAGGGTLILTGANTYTGATAVTGGTLQGTTATLPSAIAVSAGANVTFNQTSDGAFKKAISGAGTLTKEGGAVLTLQADSTYSGATVINTGTVKLGKPGLSVTGGLNAWFDASTLALGNGAAINTWADLSGQNHTATKSGGGTITLATNQVNGLSVAQFRNGDRVATLSGSLYSAQEYAVFKPDGCRRRGPGLGGAPWQW